MTAALSVYRVIPVATQFVVYRDDTIVRTPKGQDLLVPTETLAEAIAAEYRAQNVKPVFTTMPMTQLIFTALDIIAPDPAPLVDSLAAYAACDMLCHRAASPIDLAARQAHAWQPLLDWCATRFDAPLGVGEGIMPIEQPARSLSLLRNVIAASTPLHLAGLQHAVTASGSLILALALADGHIDADEAFALAELDNSYQIESWGSDPALEGRREAIRCDLALCAQWFAFLSQA